MLTGKQVRVRYVRDRILPHYLPTDDPYWVEMAERLREIFRANQDRSRGELEEDLRLSFGDDPDQGIPQGLAKLLEDRCDFEVVAGLTPEKIREAVFLAATSARRILLEGQRRSSSHLPALSFFDRAQILKEVGEKLGLSPDTVDQGLFADLKSEQHLVTFKDITGTRLLERYNVALAQAVLLKSSVVHVVIRNETPQRYRQLFRLVKFHRLVCELEPKPSNAIELHLDGPLSLFSATQKYGLQLALFLPAILLCRHFELRAELRWGPEKKAKKFHLSSDDGLVSHYPDTGTYVPPELAMFVDLFRKKILDWEIHEETEAFPLGKGFWVPDFLLRHRATGKEVFLEVLGFWRRSSAEAHIERLRKHAKRPFLLAVSDLLRIDDPDFLGLPAGIHRFRQMPLPDEIIRLAETVLGL